MHSFIRIPVTSLLLSLLLTLSTLLPIEAGAVALRAGLEQNPPLSFIDKQGNPSGLLVDILDHVAAQEGWQITYIPDTFKNCLQKLTDHEIDLMVTIAYSKERSERFDFNKVNAIANWGVFYSSSGREVQSYFDLANMKVAVMKNDIHHNAFRNLLENFDIPVNYHEVDNFENVFNAIDAGLVDGGVVGRFFALGNEDTYEVKTTPLIFNPIEVRYAAAAGLNGPILETLDKHLVTLKADPTSAYYQALDRWMGVPGKSRFPAWLKPTLIILCTLLAVATVFMVLLRWQVVGRSRKLSQEIVKRNFAQRELAVAEQNYRTLVESANAIILRWDPQGVITYINDFGRKLFGFADDELIGQNVLDTIVSDISVDGDDLVEMIHAICENPEEFHVNENENLTKSGERVWISWRNQPIHDQFGVLNGILSVGQEITERKNAEKQRLEYDRAKDVFISTAAHELRTPLTSIIGYLEILTDTPGIDSLTKEQQKKFLETAKNRSFMLAGIIDDLLDISRIQQGKPLPLQKKKESFASLAEQMTRHYQSSHPGYSFQLQIDDGLVHNQLFDPVRMSQVFENLLNNAVKYSQTGSEIVTKLTATEDGLQVCICDEGIGITPEHAEKVFDEFYRVDNSNTSVGGLGLGMGIVQQIILEHGGNIWMESTPDVGTDVYFTLPDNADDR